MKRLSMEDALRIASQEDELVRLSPKVLKELADYKEAADWYIECLQDVLDRKVVRGLGEARAGYEALRDSLAGEGILL
jgi:hypothetical protein